LILVPAYLKYPVKQIALVCVKTYLKIKVLYLDIELSFDTSRCTMDSPCMLVHNALPRNFGDTTWEYSRNTLADPALTW
jgi:hypothetical protein